MIESSINHLDLQYLPSGAVAWLYDRPDEQVAAAAELAAFGNQNGIEFVEASLLRSDNNVLIVHTRNGHRISIYPAGGYGMDGQPYDLMSLGQALSAVSSTIAPVVSPTIQPQGLPQADIADAGSLELTPDDLAVELPNDMGWNDIF